MQGAIEKDFLNLLSAHCTTEKGVRQYTLFYGRLAQRERSCLTSRRSRVRILYRPPFISVHCNNARFLFWALSSAGEHHLHTVGVAGSNPVAPTIELPGQKFVCFWLFCFAPSFDFFSGISLVIRGIMSCLFSFPF